MWALMQAWAHKRDGERAKWHADNVPIYRSSASGKRDRARIYKLNIVQKSFEQVIAKLLSNIREYVCMYIYMYVCIYMYRERERQREREVMHKRF